jgi:hypothetical protein
VHLCSSSLLVQSHAERPYYTADRGAGACQPWYGTLVHVCAEVANVHRYQQKAVALIHTGLCKAACATSCLLLLLLCCCTRPLLIPTLLLCCTLLLLLPLLLTKLLLIVLQLLLMISIITTGVYYVESPYSEMLRAILQDREIEAARVKDDNEEEVYIHIQLHTHKTLSSSLCYHQHFL